MTRKEDDRERAMRLSNTPRRADGLRPAVSPVDGPLAALYTEFMTVLAKYNEEYPGIGPLVLNHGQIQSMKLPEGWIEGEPRSNVVGRSSLREFHPPDKPEVMICLYYRGLPVGAKAGDCFRTLLSEPAHLLKGAEMKSLEEILGEKADKNSFSVIMPRTENLKGRRVLVVEGQYKVLQTSTYALYINADGAGRIVQEIFFWAPTGSYERYLRDVRQTFQSVSWK